MPYVVLVVESNADLRANISHILRQPGHLVLAVRDGETALEVAEDNPISLVVIDPGSLPNNGFEIYLRLRTSVKTAHVPILILVNGEAGIAQMTSQGFRANSFLMQPFTREELLERVRVLLHSTKRIRQKILIVEHDTDMRHNLSLSLLSEGYLVLALDDCAPALEVALKNAPGLIILDLISTPDGIDICKQLRSCSETVDIPLLLIISSTNDIAQIEAGGIHANDYLVKPFLWEELCACVHALLRGGKRGPKPKQEAIAPKPLFSGKKGEVLVMDGLTIDVDQQLILRGDQEIRLNSAILFALFLYLAHRRGVAVSREELQKQIWGSETAIDKHTVDVHIHLLRQKLQDDLEHPRLIRTVLGIGYCFKN